MFSATMHRVYFSHLEVPADFARGKKVYLELDIKVQKKFILWRFKNYPSQIVLL